MVSESELGEMSSHFIVCGLGNVGLRSVELLAQIGEQGVAISLDFRDDWRRKNGMNFAMLPGDARKESLLMQAGILRARGILIVTNDEPANVTIALEARRLNPDIVIVVRMFDQKLAAQLEQTSRIDRILSASALAAPAFAAAALGSNVRGSFEVEGASFQIDEQRFSSDIFPSASAVSDTVFIAQKQDGGIVSGLADSKSSLRPGDPIIRLRMLEGKELGGDKAKRALFSWRTGFLALLRGWQGTAGLLRMIMIALLGVVIFSIVLFRISLGISWVDSLYFVITTVTTTGYGDYNLMTAPVPIKLYGVFLMLCGATLFATLFSLITDRLLRTRFRDVISHGQSEFSGHIIVVGLGDIGFRMVRELSGENESVVAIEQKEDGEFVQSVRELLPVVIGDARAEEILRKAGIGGARAIIAATDNDISNLSIGLAARQANAACRVVLRIFDPALGSSIPQSMGVNAVLSVSSAAAPTFAGSVLAPDVRHGILLRDRLAVIFHRTVPSAPRETGSMSENEIALFRKPSGGRYESIDDSRPALPGDKIIGIRWHPFRPGAGIPIKRSNPELISTPNIQHGISKCE